MEQYTFLPHIHSPADVKKLTLSETEALGGEIRHFLVTSVTKTGGHLASNLGMVEITLGMHRVFSSPEDHFIFDVGHQSYIHKIVTGRLKEFDTLRQNGGLSGFTKRSESEHDPFGAGHASTSLSAAIGMATADRMQGKDTYTVCVTGDGAFTGGMIHEALNNVRRDLHLIVILNENEMSISPNTGRFATHLAKLRSSEGYSSLKKSTRNFLNAIPLIGRPLFETVRTLKQNVKNVLYHSNYFEDLGLYYLGPIDGNDLEMVETTLKTAKRYGQCVVIHAKTVKGKGWEPAEKAPDVFHAVAAGKYDITAKNVKKEYSDISFSEIAGNTIASVLSEEIREKGTAHYRVITAAMTDGCGLRVIADTYPSYLTDVGIAEEHAVTYAAGLSAGGIHPVVTIYSSFLQRSYDNLIHDVALQKLPLTLCIDRAGFNEGDGPTHHGIFDVAMLSELPDCEIYTPLSYRSLERILSAVLKSDTFSAARYPRGKENPELNAHFSRYQPEEAFLKSDFPETEQKEVLLVSYGRITAEAVKAEKILSEKGISAGVLLLEKLTPFETRAGDVGKFLSDKTKTLVFLEEGIFRGGAGMLYRDLLLPVCTEKHIRTEILAIHNPFAPSEKGKRMAETAGLDAKSIVRTVTGE